MKTITFTDFRKATQGSRRQIEAYTATGMARSILTNWISYLLNLHGPSEPIDTAYSSSLVAVHRDVEAIRTGVSITGR